MAHDINDILWGLAGWPKELEEAFGRIPGRIGESIGKEGGFAIGDLVGLLGIPAYSYLRNFLPINEMLARESANYMITGEPSAADWAPQAAAIKGQQQAALDANIERTARGGPQAFTNASILSDFGQAFVNAYQNAKRVAKEQALMLGFQGPSMAYNFLNSALLGRVQAKAANSGK
jgi:hypothetical protein